MMMAIRRSRSQEDRRAVAPEDRQLPPRTRRDAQPRRPTDGERPPRDKLYARRYLALDEYRRELARGSYKQLSNLEKMQLFGWTIVPIHVPLAPGETKDQYEARFRGWLAGLGLVREELEKDPDENLERFYWFKFAGENARGVVKYKPPANKRGEHESGAEAELTSRKRPRFENGEPNGQCQVPDVSDHDGLDKKARVEENALKKVIHNTITGQDDEPGKTSRKDEGSREEEMARRSTSCTTGDPPVLVNKDDSASQKFQCTVPARNASVEEATMAYSSCGCRQCLARGMQHLAMAVTKLEARKCATCMNNVVDLTSVNERDTSSYDRHPSSPTSPRDPRHQMDPGEIQLIASYDEINEQIVMNEIALQTEIERLAANPLTDIQEMTRLHDENQEMQEMLQGEMVARNAVLAALVVYMWRHDPGDLESMMNDPAAQHVVPVQRLGHTRCAQIAAAMAEKQDYVAKLNRQLDSMQDSETASKRLAIMKLRVQEMIHKAESEIQMLHDQRRQQLRVLVHFDADLRKLIQSLLTQATKMA